MQIRKIFFRPGRSVERLHICSELNQIARDKSRSQPQMAQELDEQPAGIAAGTRTLDERFFRRLHAGFEPDQVFDVPRQLPVEVHEKIIAPLLLT